MPSLMTRARNACILTKAFTFWARSSLWRIIAFGLRETKGKGLLLRNLLQTTKVNVLKGERIRRIKQGYSRECLKIYSESSSSSMLSKFHASTRGFLGGRMLMGAMSRAAPKSISSVRGPLDVVCLELTCSSSSRLECLEVLCSVSSTGASSSSYSPADSELDKSTAVNILSSTGG